MRKRTDGYRIEKSYPGEEPYVIAHGLSKDDAEWQLERLNAIWSDIDDGTTPRPTFTITQRRPAQK